MQIFENAAPYGPMSRMLLGCPSHLRIVIIGLVHFKPSRDAA